MSYTPRWTPWHSCVLGLIEGTSALIRTWVDHDLEGFRSRSRLMGDTIWKMMRALEATSGGVRQGTVADTEEDEAAARMEDRLIDP